MTVYVVLVFLCILIGMAISVSAFGTGGKRANIIKAAMVRVWQRLRAEVPAAKLILQIHDELIVEAPFADAERAAEILHTEMEQACVLSVPLTAEVQEGQSWYDAKG